MDGVVQRQWCLGKFPGRSQDDYNRDGLCNHSILQMWKPRIWRYGVGVLGAGPWKHRVVLKMKALIYTHSAKHFNGRYSDGRFNFCASQNDVSRVQGPIIGEKRRTQKWVDLEKWLQIGLNCAIVPPWKSRSHVHCTVAYLLPYLCTSI